MAGGGGLAMGEPLGTLTVVMVTLAGELLGATYSTCISTTRSRYYNLHTNTCTCTRLYTLVHVEVMQLPFSPWGKIGQEAQCIY